MLGRFKGRERIRGTVGGIAATAAAVAAGSFVAAAMALSLKAQDAVGMQAAGEGSLVGVHAHVRP